MNITLLAAEIARRVPDMARDSAANNEELIASLIRAETLRGTVPRALVPTESRLARAVGLYNQAFGAALSLPADAGIIRSAALIAQEHGRDDIASELREAIA